VRILHLASYGNPVAGSFVPLIAALARRLRARGDTFGFAVMDVPGATWHRDVRDAGAELHVLGGGAREAAQLARAWRPDVAHVHFFGWEPAVTLALAASRARVFWHAHSTSLGAPRTLRTLVKYRLVGARVERFVAISHALAREIEALGAPARRTVVVSNEIDVQRFRAPSRAERDGARAALGLDGPTVLFYGRDPHIKGADVLARALARTAGLTVLAVGTPPAARAALAAHARVVEVERADDVVPLLWAADALATPSRGEGLSFATQEAAATALPVVASDLPALHESGGPDARFFPSEDADALADALRAALATPRPTDLPASHDGGVARWAERIIALYG
jgi:glycosyltransferase involved in cell wall biosynthesis